MHELSIATSMIAMAMDEAVRLGDVRVRAVHLRLGPLSGVVGDALQFSWKIACEDTPLAGARLVIDESPVVVRCDACGEDRTLPEHWQLCCPVCGGLTPDILAGNELEIVALEVE